MKVKFKGERKIVKFKDLNKGDCFLDEDGDLIMKVGATLGSEFDRVVLETGVLFCGGSNEKVIPVEATAHVKAKKPG